MKRTRLLLDERVLEEAVTLSGQRTYSAVVNMALDQFVRRLTAARILSLTGSGAWDGDLSEMRGDRIRRSGITGSSHRDPR